MCNDLSRLLDTLTICEAPNGVWQLGIESDGVQAVEEFVFARYWMFIQVYFHKTRRIFDYYLVNFLKECLPGGKYPARIHEYGELTDSSILELIKNKKDNNIWAFNLYNRKSMKEVFVSTPHQLKDSGVTDNRLNLDDYYKLGWIDEEFRKRFPVSEEPENYYVDQANTSSAKEQIRIKTVLEESSDADPSEVKLFAIPVRDKHSSQVKPIQDYSLPIKSLSDKKVNIIRIYANSKPMKQLDQNPFTEAKGFCEKLEDLWKSHYAEVKDTVQKAEEAQAKLEAYKLAGKQREDKFKS